MKPFLIKTTYLRESQLLTLLFNLCFPVTCLPGFYVHSLSFEENIRSKKLLVTKKPIPCSLMTTPSVQWLPS